MQGRADGIDYGPGDLQDVRVVNINIEEANLSGQTAINSFAYHTMVGIILSNWRYKVNENIPPGGIFAANLSFNFYDTEMKCTLHGS